MKIFASLLYIISFVATVLISAPKTHNALEGNYLVFEKETIHINEPILLETGSKIKEKILTGIASWYGEKHHGKEMADGNIFDMNKVSAAHRSLPLGSKVLIENPTNGKAIVATITDRGPFTKKNGRYSREIDLSKRAAEKLGLITKGLGYVKIRVIA